MYSGGSGLSIDIHFVVIELSYDVLSPLPIVLSKHFNHPHPYIEIATAISDTHWSVHTTGHNHKNLHCKNKTSAAGLKFCTLKLTNLHGAVFPVERLLDLDSRAIILST